MKVLVRLVCSVALLVGALQAKADQEFDWSSSSSGFYTIQYLGAFNNGVVSGNLYRKTVTRTAFTFLTPPATPLPANLTHLVSYGDFVLNSLSQVVYRGELHATLWNDTGDALYALGVASYVNGNSYGSEYQFTGGAGAFEGASGWWTTNGTVLPNSQQSWISQAHLVLPTAPVPEPETYAMLLAGLGLMAGVARRRKTA